MKYKSKAMALFLAILMILNIMPNMCVTAHADGEVTYIERYGGGIQETKTAPSDSVIYNGQGTLNSGWYIVDQTYQYNGRIVVRGDVKLILVDGATLTATEGVRVAEGNTLTIYGQVHDSGKLVAHGSKYNAGIGANDADDDEESAAGTIIIHGGTIEARGGREAAGIGGGNESRGGDVTIYGGKIKAVGGRYGAGIGGGDEADNRTTVIYGGEINATGSAEGGAGIGGGDEGSGGVITIHGGFVTAEGKYNAAAIGGGCYGSSGTITINGGSVQAYANKHVPNRGAGIGSGSEADQGGVITINGGIVQAYSKNGAGIGAGYNADGGTVNINNGLVTASSENGAGIGGGAFSGLSSKGNGGTVNINYGIVIAVSTKKGAGIGGGNDGDGGTVNINGGHVTAYGGYLKYEHWKSSISPDFLDSIKGLPEGGNIYKSVAAFIADLIFSGEYAGAGIGGGDGGEGANVKIISGVVIAKSGKEDTPAIGHGYDGDENGSLSVYDSAMVSCGSLDGSGDVVPDTRPVPAADRETEPGRRPFAMIEPCDHLYAEYESAGKSGHWAHCVYCKHPDSEILPHEFDESGHLCTKCGYERVLVTFLPGEGTGEMKAVYIDKDVDYNLPDCSFNPPEGKSFSGWRASGGGVPAGVYPAGSSVIPTGDLTLTAQWADPYKLWVGGIQVTSDNKDDVLGDGKVTYDPETCTLHFDNVTDLGGEKLKNNTLVYSEGINLTLTGRADLRRSSGDYADGIHIVSGSLTIDGDFNVGDAKMNAVTAELDIILAGGTITVNGTRYGLRANRNMFIRDGITRVQSDGGTKAMYFTKISVGPSIVLVEYGGGQLGLPFGPDDYDPREFDDTQHIVLERGNTVSFVLNGGEMDGQTGTVERVFPRDTIEKPNPDPERGGYVFDCWCTDPELTDEFDFVLDLPQDTLYARWQKTWEVEKHWEAEDGEDLPEELDVVLQKKDGDWQTIETKTLTAADADDEDDNIWKETFEITTGAAEVTTENFRIRELDKDGYPVLSADAGDDGSAKPSVILEVDGEDKGYNAAYEMDEDAGRMTITNSSVKKYTVEVKWDIDWAVGNYDRPDEIEVALQKQEGKFSWKTIDVITLQSPPKIPGPLPSTEGEFDPVPAGYVNDTGTFVRYEYRVREIAPPKEGEQVPDPEEDEEEYYKSCDKRTVYDTFDFDKPFIKNLLAIADPDNVWTVDATLAWLEAQAQKIVIPVPSFVTHIDAYRDEIKDVSAHDTKYHVGYSHNSETHKMTITDTAVIDASIYKRWINFKDDEMPEYVYIMLMSKVDDDYAERAGVEEMNIYTPVFTCMYGPQLSITNVPELDVRDELEKGVSMVLGDGIQSSVVSMALEETLQRVTKTGIALVKVNEGGGWNPIAKWHTYFGVKKYGGFGVPMEFAGAELVTGLLEMVLDIIIKEAHIPKLSVPIMYHPVLDCWSIKGYAFNIPTLDKDYELTGNVINFKVHWDGSDGNKISGVKHWVDNGADDRPESVTLKLYAKDKDGEKTELSISPITVTGDGDDWPWSAEVPLSEIVAYDKDAESEEDTVYYKEIVVEEEPVSGYETTYDGYDITNKKEGIDKIEVSGKKTWNDNEDAEGKRPSSITIKLLGDGEEKASRTVTEDDGWAWTFKDLPKYQNDGTTEITYSIKEAVVPEYETSYDEYNVTNTYSGETPTITITVNGNTDSREYNGDNQSFEGSFTATSSDPDFDASRFSYSGTATASGKDVGEYTVDPHEGSCSYEDDDHVIIWEMGDPVKLTITPAELEIEVTGHTAVKEYTGSEQQVEGYDKSCSSDLFDESQMSYVGKEAVARGTEAGTYPMGLNESDFMYLDTNVNARFDVTDGWLKIHSKPEPDELLFTVVGHKDTVIYNGSEQTVTGYDIYCSGDYDETKVKFTGEDVAKGTDVSTYPMGLTASQFNYEDENYRAVFDVTDGELKIDPATLNIKIEGNKATYTYDGAEHSASGYTASCKDAGYDESNVTFSGEKEVAETDAGTYPMGLDASQFSYTDKNYKATFDVTDGELKINPAELTIEITGNKGTYPYDGTEHSTSGYKAECGSSLYKESNIGFTGTASVTKRDAGDYHMGLAASQFYYVDNNVTARFDVTDGELKITPAELTISITGDKKEYVYDGSEHTAEGYEAECESSLYDEGNIRFTGTASVTKKDVGTYPMGLKDTDFTYNDKNVQASFKVTDGELKITEEPKKITITVIGTTDTKVYTGEEQSVTGYRLVCKDEYFDESKVNFNGEEIAAGTDVGNYPMGLDISQFSYNDENVDAKFEITDGWLKIIPAKLTIEVTGHTDVVTYDGYEHTVEGYDLECDDKELYDASNVVFQEGSGVIPEATGTIVGDYPMGLDSSQFSYNDENIEAKFVITDGWLKITPAKLTVEVTGHTDVVTYDGEEHTVEGYELECDDQLFIKELVGFEGEACAKGTDVDTYPMGLEEDQFSYNDPNIEAEFEITDGWLQIDPPSPPEKIIITIIGAYDVKTYSGEEQSVEGYVALSASDFDESKVVFKGDPSAVPITTGTDVGIYRMGLDASQFSYNDENIEAEFRILDGRLIIKPASLMIEVTGHTDVVTYDGEEHTVESYDLECDDKELYDASKVVFKGESEPVATGTTVGDYPMGLVENLFSYSDPNIEAKFEITDGWLKIKPAKLTIEVTGHTDVETYDGEEHTVKGYDLECDDNLFNEEAVGFEGEACAKGTDVDTYPMGLEGDQFSYNDENIEVEFEITDGWLKINPATLTINITGDKKEFKYDGQPHTAEGYKAECDSTLYDESKIVFTGKAIVTETEEGVYPMGLAEDQFSYDDGNFENVTFNVEDGELKITKDPSPGPSPVIKTWTITYDLNGGTYNGSGNNIYENYPDGTVITIHVAPVREGYTFLYWKGSSYSPGDQYTVADNHVFTAVWEKNSDPSDVPDSPGTGDSSQSAFWLTLMLLMTGLSVVAAGMRIRYR